MQVLVRQGEELKALQAQLAERDAALTTALTENVDLTLKASISKAHRIVFDDPWIVETQHFRCRGASRSTARASCCWRCRVRQRDAL